MENTLQHHGVKGMKWGVIRRRQKSKSNASDKVSIHLKDLTDNELRARISRLEMEKRYKDLTKSEEQRNISKGKAFVTDVLEKSGKNIATQATTYVLGTTVNKVAGKEIVNPKKGQKDK